MIDDRYVELRGFHHYVFARYERPLTTWLERGFVKVPAWRVFAAICFAFDHFTPPDLYAQVWERLFPERSLPPLCDHNVELELARAARAPVPSLYVLERRVERGVVLDTPKLQRPPLPPRTATDHHVVIAAVTDTEPPLPVAGVRLELLIADGEVKSAQTDTRGLARVERIQAGRVVIRVLDLDGTRWRPLDGDASRPSESGQRPRAHVVAQGECLARIARNYGLGSWRELWNAPENAELRKRRKRPHVLHPGDEVSVPGASVHEIIRPTDAAHRIAITQAPFHLAVVLRDFNGLTFAEEPYELWVAGEATPRTGQTGPDGLLRAALPAHAAQLEVACPRLGMRWHFALGTLDPLDGGAIMLPAGERRARPEHSSVRGLQARLHALGYAPGAVTGAWNAETERALSAFQVRELGVRSGEASAWTTQSDEALNARYGA